MLRIRSIVATAMLSLWLPLMVHCHLETIAGLEFLQCVSDSGHQTDCSGDSCCAVEKSQYKAEENLPAVSVPAIVLTPCLPVLATTVDSVKNTSDVSSVPSVAPPELPRCWQFVFRTASPPRAPSFAS